MTIEKDLIVKTDVDLSDYVRTISEEGNSRKSSIATLKTLIEEGTSTPYISVVGSGDDKGLIATEQFSVGKPNNPKESAFGAGDSYPVGTEHVGPTDTPEPGSAWHCTMDNTTGNIITSAIDVTTELASDSGSSVGLFNGITAGKYLLLGSDHRFAGLKVKVTTAGDIDPDSVQGECCGGPDGDTWAQPEHMVSKADYPYTQRANNIATVSGESEQWHFGFNPLVERSTWEQQTININGTDYTKYWARLRITSDITTDPQIEQIKLHTDRFEINADGTTEYYGLGVYPQTIQSGINKLVRNNVSTLASQSVTYQSSQAVAGYANNKFNNNAANTALIIQNILHGIHTAVPLVLSLSYYVDGNVSGDIEWETSVYHIADGFKYDGTSTPTEYSQIDTVDSTIGFTRRTVDILIPISVLTYNDSIVIKIKRDAGNANLDDTVPAAIVLTNMRLTAHFWKP